MRFTHIKVEDGLSQSSVNSVIKDKNGYYWIGTQFGLNKFDGKNITTIYANNTSQLADNFILKAVEDAEKNIWFATRNNICRYNSTTQTFLTLNTDTIKGIHFGHNSIWHLFTDSQKNIVFSSGGRFLKINKQQQSAKSPKLEYVLNNNSVFSLAYIVQNEFVGLIKDTIYKYNLEKNKCVLQKKIKASEFAQADSRILFQCEDEYIILTNNKLYTIQNDSVHQLFKTQLSNTKINCITKFKKHYYVGTDDGLFVFDNHQKLTNIYKTHDSNAFSISENKILSISITHDGLLWIGHSNSGLSVFDEKSIPFKIIKPEENKPYISNCCCLKNDSTLFVGTSNGIDEFNLKNDIWVYKCNTFYNHKITALHYKQNQLYIGTTNGLFSLANSGFADIELQKKSPTIFDIKSNAKNQLIVSSIVGVFILDANNTIIYHLDKKTIIDGKPILTSNYIFNTTIDKENNYYINSTSGSITLNEQLGIKNKPFKNFKYKSQSEIMITDVVINQNNIVWYGTLGNGIYRFRNDSFTQINQLNGLSNNVIAALKTDLNGVVWASTNNGINCIKPNNYVLQFTKEIAVSSPEFITNGSFQKGNQLFFCSNSGVVAFNSEVVLNSNLLEKLNLNLVSIFKNHTDTIEPSNIVALTYTDKIVSLTFNVPSFRYYKKIKLQYKLKGFDDEWRSFENGKPITFTNLNYGEYHLYVKGELPEYNWQQSSELVLIVSPPFWKTTWFIVLSSILCITLIVYIVWYISRIKIKKQLIEMKIIQSVFEEKDRISKDLHDNIGSQISMLISGIDKITITQKAESAERLSDYARNTLSELRETIWALNTTEIDLIKLKQKFEDLVFELRTNYEFVHINFEFTYDKNHNFNPQQVLMFYRIVQEAANNALKHSQCKSLQVKIKKLDKILTANIIDDGIGFDVTHRKKAHYGLDNMHERAQKSGFKFEINSSKESGTTINLTAQL